MATKAIGVERALERIATAPPFVLPLLNGLDHVALLRERFAPESGSRGRSAVEADRPAPGVVVHTSPFLLGGDGESLGVRAAGDGRAGRGALGRGISARADRPIGERAEAQVMWSKLVRLNALACTTSAYDKLLGEIRSTPELRADLIGAIEESCAAGQAEGADNVRPKKAIEELENAHATLGSSMQRDIAAGRAPEVDAIRARCARRGPSGVRCRRSSGSWR